MTSTVVEITDWRGLARPVGATLMIRYYSCESTCASIVF